jgi:enediyne biosynthesis protein E5
MKPEFVNTTLLFYPSAKPGLRMFALVYFCSLLIVWTVVGHTVLGFEQAWAHPVAGVAAAMGAHFLLEWVHAWSQGRRVRWAGGLKPFLLFLPPAIIPGLACAMLLYPNERIMPVVLASVVSIASKVIFRAPVGNGMTQHIFNPSNFGILFVLLIMPSVGMAPPYQFTENVTGVWDWIIPLAVLATGLLLHGVATGRLPLVSAWLVGFAAQGLLRAAWFGTPWRVPFVPMTSAAFILFTLYMIPDPATTPLAPRRQVLFGLAVAAVYGVLFILHVVFGLFIALFAVCAVRGVGMYVAHRKQPVEEMTPVSRPVTAGA